MTHEPPLLDLRSTGTIKTCRWLTALALAIGIGGRLFYYLSRPSYWNDEAAIVINVMSRTWRQLLQPLDYAQAAPPLFLWIERGLFKVFGSNEFALRSFPLIVSVLGLLLFAKLAWRVLPATSAAWSVAFLAMFGRLIHISGDVKQYGCDVLATVALLLAAFGRGEISAGRRALRAGIVGAVAIWLSFPSIFVAGAIGLSLLPACIRGRRRGFGMWVAGNALLGASFAALYFIALSRKADPYLFEFWAEAFPNWHRPIRWVSRNLYDAVAYPFDFFGPLAAILVVLGLIALIRMRLVRLAVILVLSLALAFIAAAAHRYPFPEKRLTAFLVPLFFLTLGAAAEGQNLRLPKGLCDWWWIVPALLMFLVGSQFTKSIYAPERGSTMRPLVKQLRPIRKADEAIYLFGDAKEPLRPSGRNAELLCYWPHPAGKVVVGFVAAEAIPEKRFWVVYSLGRPGELKQHGDALLKILGQPHVIKRLEAQGQAGAMLIENGQ